MPGDKTTRQRRRLDGRRHRPGDTNSGAPDASVVPLGAATE